VIDSSGFGTMKIDGIRYSGDLIILGREIRPGWRRREGHRLQWEDLESEIESDRERIPRGLSSIIHNYNRLIPRSGPRGKRANIRCLFSTDRRFPGFTGPSYLIFHF
jgi:hypothetical protein